MLTGWKKNNREKLYFDFSCSSFVDALLSSLAPRQSKGNKYNEVTLWNVYEVNEFIYADKRCGIRFYERMKRKISGKCEATFYRNCEN